MKREFLEAFGLDKALVDKILDENSKDIGKEKAKTDQAKEDIKTLQGQIADRDKDIADLRAAQTDTDGLKNQLEALQTKYTTETDQYKQQLADRDYMDAINASISDLKFSSKAAKSAFVAGLKENKLELKDGKLTDFDKYLKTQKDSDPDAFVPDKPRPFVKSIGDGGAPATPASESVGAKYARMYNAQYAPKTQNTTQATPKE